MKKVKYKGLLGVSMGITASVLAIHLEAYAPPVTDEVRSFVTTASEPPPLALPTESEFRAALLNPWAVQPVSPNHIDSETLWLARLMFSETKRLDEQELVAWVVRNRVESAFRGQTTIESVVRDPFQFSAFNPGTAQGRFYCTLNVLSKVPGWQKTLALAYYVRHADRTLSPFSPNVRHFYSEQAMAEPGTVPEWSEGLEPVIPRRAFMLDEYRFRFYANVN